VVLDPVLASTDDVPLLDEGGVQTLIRDLVPLCDLLTPNLIEAEVLTGIPVIDLDSAADAGIALLKLGVKNILVTGGHFPAQATDTLITQDEPQLVYSGHLFETQHTHGTGCLLSAGIAAMLAKGTILRLSIAEAKALIYDGLSDPVTCGKGRGYPNAFSSRTRMGVHGRSHAERLELINGLYVVTDSKLRPGRNHVGIVRAAFAGGARVVQFREKQRSTRLFCRQLETGYRLADAHHALLLVNDRVDLAAFWWMDGVHLGPDDMHPADARGILGPDKLIGVSVSTVEEAKRIAAYASYLGVGAIYRSKTKDDAGSPVGLERIRQFKRAFPHLPIVAIGGINKDNIADVAAAGADAAAVVSAAVCADDMEQAVRDLRARFEQGNKRR
jgi:thiamine-phosphate diphosphorylase